VLSNSLCTQCENAAALAQLCSADPTCVGFSNLHGLLANVSVQAAALALATTAPFTSTPCKVVAACRAACLHVLPCCHRLTVRPLLASTCAQGLYIRANLTVPTDVESLDRLLCGKSQYCQTPPIYTWQSNSAGGSVDVVASFSASFLTPTWLTSTPNAATAAALPQMPLLRRLRVECQAVSEPCTHALPAPLLQLQLLFAVCFCLQGVQLVGGLPKQLLQQAGALMSFTVAGCGVQDTLPPGTLVCAAAASVHRPELLPSPCMLQSWGT
jgi:hypothetical protein